MKYAVLFIALLFAGCDEGSSTDGGYETFTIAGETMQVAKEDFPKSMSWDDAQSACEGLGNGWRLPSEDELKAMYEQLHKQGKGNFKDDWYWSSSQSLSRSAWLVGFLDGSVGYDVNGKGFNYRVRAVRAKP
ncbi:MAG: DUF1566 domain-containing protein [Bacteroidetes bacterium]|nr:DUF1566 domain-containing protein [Bacteroidota bacterium]